MLGNSGNVINSRNEEQAIESAITITKLLIADIRDTNSQASVRHFAKIHRHLII